MCIRDSILALNQLPDMYKPLKEMMMEYLKGNYSAYKGSKELYDVMSQLNYDAKEILNKYFDKVEIYNLTYFMTQEDNPRIKASIDDVAINKYAGIVSGIIIMILFTYVISVFVIYEIEEENVIIGSDVYKRQVENESKVQQAISTLIKDKTVLVLSLIHI